MEAQPAVIGLVLRVFLDGRFAGCQHWQRSFGFAQEQSILPLQIHRSPALPILPEFGIAIDILSRPSKASQFIGAMGEFFGHAAC